MLLQQAYKYTHFVEFDTAEQSQSVMESVEH